MTYFVYDGVTGPTPLANLRAGEAVNTFDMMMGNIRGTIGETSVIAIMIGAMFFDPDGRDRSSDSGNLYRNICNLYHSVRRSWL